MPVKRNMYYHDPYIQQGFDNLANAFKPPSPGQMAQYAKARAEKENAERLAYMFKYAQGPDFNRDYADRLGVFSGMYNPTQSYYKVDSDHTQALRTTEMNNRTALEKAQLEADAALQRQMANPITAPKDSVVYLPNQTSAGTGLAPMLPGQVSMQPGEKVVMPDGTTHEGNAKAPTMSEWEAQEAARMRSSGMLNDQMMLSRIMGPTPIEAVQTPQGPRNVFRNEAVGQEPVMSTDKAQLANYETKDGTRSGQARFDPTQGWVDTQTGEKLPRDIKTFSISAQGSRESVGLGPTTANTTAGNNRAAEATRTLDILDLYEGLIRNKPGVAGLPGLIRGTAQNVAAVASDMANSFGKSAPQIEAAAADIRNGMQNIAPDFFEPGIPEAQFYQGTLAYALARTENPSGEVSRQAFERAYERVRGGMLSNPEQILATIGAFRKTLQTEIGAIGTLRNPAAARTDTGFKDPVAPGAAATAAPKGGTGAAKPVERWERGPDNKLRRAQ